MRAWRLLMRLASVPPGGLRAEVSRLDCSANAVIPFTSPPGDDAATLVVATGAVPVFLGLGALPQRLHIGETGVRRRAPFRRQPLFDAAETPCETSVGVAQRGFRIDLGLACDVAAHQQESADFMAHARRGAARRHLGAQLGDFFFELRHHLLEIFPIETDPRHALIQAEKRHAYACAQAQRLPQAIALYQKSCERDPADAEAWFMLGTLRGRSGDHAGAEAALRQALAVFPEFAQACLNLGPALELHGTGAEAEACSLRDVALKPDLAEAHEALGRLCQQRGEWPAAEEHYQVALRLHPAATGAALALAALFTRRGRLPDALAALEQAWHHDHTH